MTIKQHGGIFGRNPTFNDVSTETLSATFTGTTTIPTADINGGSIDGATIGANSAGAITGTTITGTGLVSAQDGLVVDNSGATVATFDRGASDGDIVEFQQGGSQSGEVGSVGTFSLYIGTQSNTGYIATSGNTIRYSWSLYDFSPYNDNTRDLGQSGKRWDDVYATNGTIQTSDRNEKQDIETLSEAEQRVAVAANSLIRKFRWNSAVAEKGDDARIHFGIIAQDLQAAFEAEGLDASRYAMFISSTWWESEETYTDDDGVEHTRINTYDTAEEAPEGATEHTRLGVRYSELLAFITAGAAANTSSIIAALEARISALEEGI